MSAFKHPLSKYYSVMSINGECDEGDEGPRSTGPNAVGMITDVYLQPGPCWNYQVYFAKSHVWVFIDQHQLDDENNYREILSETETIAQLIDALGIVLDLAATNMIDQRDATDESLKTLREKQINAIEIVEEYIRDSLPGGDKFESVLPDG